ncbi:MarR family transcriptional regulator [Dactylosporangium sp. NPDC051484]|uniref:MarR family winged helix-turn-helix transcriptional regulator n=1 Tax=Dactylosporangium sp. NPDC051484 TaxID=3154942 RepID=UPI0034503EB1
MPIFRFAASVMPVAWKTPAGATLTQRVHRAATTIRRHIEHEILGPAKLTLTSYEILHTLWIQGACPPADIIRITGIRAPTVSEAASRLVSDQLVTRRVNARDARSYRLQLTPAGRRLVGRLVKDIEVDEAEVLDGLSAEALTAAKALLDHLQPGAAGPNTGVVEETGSADSNQASA